ncbi:hypothetical protein CCP4SC76_3620001 [Gammaproteobacteria bacterium]
MTDWLGDPPRQAGGTFIGNGMTQAEALDELRHFYGSRLVSAEATTCHEESQT